MQAQSADIYKDLKGRKDRKHLPDLKSFEKIYLRVV
jgi:hypothetical protein